MRSISAARPTPQPAPALSAAALVYLRGRDADARIQALVAERRELRPALGTLAVRLVKRRRYESLGFRSLGDYARERLGVTATVVREWARVSAALAGLPRLRAAVVAGEVSWSVARRAVAHASAETDAAFAEALRGRTLRAAEALLAAAFPGEAPVRVDDAERVPVRVLLPASRHGAWLAAQELARRMAGEALPAWECAEAVAAEAIAALPSGVVERAAGGVGDRPAPSRRASAASRRPRAPTREHGLRHEAFRGLRWPGGDAPSLPLERIAILAEHASPHALDRALRRAMRRLQRIEHDLGRILRQMLDRRLHRELGFDTFARYVEERVDVSPRTARRWVRFARLGSAGGAVANAFRAGLVTPRQAALVAERVSPSRHDEAIAFARRVTFRCLEGALDAAGGAGGEVAFHAPPEAANVFRLALEATRLHLDGLQPARASDGDAFAWMLDHAVATWLEQGAAFRDYADFERDGWRCTAPGCTARRNLHSHHILFRSAGGPDESWNRTTLCAFHHLRGIHARVVACRGRAPDGLHFELGLRPVGPPLLRLGPGEVMEAC